jgi:hypothetical protein
MTLNEFTGCRMLCEAAWASLHGDCGDMPEKWARNILELAPSTYYRYLWQLAKAVPDEWREWGMYQQVQSTEVFDRLYPRVAQCLDRQRQRREDLRLAWAQEREQGGHPNFHPDVAA